MQTQLTLLTLLIGKSLVVPDMVLVQCLGSLLHGTGLSLELLSIRQYRWFLDSV